MLADSKANFKADWQKSRSFPLRLGRALLICGALLLAARAQAVTVEPIDLNAFTYGDPPANVAVAADGESATLNEDPVGGSVVLINDPYFGDDVVIVADEDTYVVFDYDFSGSTQDDDTFSAAVFDSDTGDLIPGADFATGDLGTGLVGEIALGPLAGMGYVLGMQFELLSNPFGPGIPANALVTIRNLRLETRSASTVPEPAGVMLALLLVPALGRRRRRARARRAR